jgi:hypothetical protein
MIEALIGILMGIAFARLSYSIGSRTDDKRSTFHSLAFISLLIILLAYHVHNRSTYSEYARLELLFIRLGIAAMLGFCGYWIYLIVRDGNPRIPDVGETAKLVFKYIAMGVGLILTMLLLYLEPSPLLSRLARGIAAVEGYGVKLQFQGQASSGVGAKNDDYANKTQSEPVQSFEPTLDSKNVAHFFLRSFAQNREKDSRLMREVTGKELQADQTVSRLLSKILVPAYGCLLQLEQSGLDPNGIAEPLRKLNHQLRAEMYILDQTGDSSPGSRLMVALAMINFTRALQEQNKLRKPSLEYGLPKDDTDRYGGQCERIRNKRTIEVWMAVTRALRQIDIRQGRLHVIGAAMALNDNERLRALEILDRWIFIVVRTAQGKAAKTPVVIPRPRDSMASAMAAAATYCRTGYWPGAPNIRPIIDLAPLEVEDLLLTCLNIVRVRYLQTRILQLYPPNSQKNIGALVELYASAAELVEAVWKFTTERSKGKDDHSRALRVMCHSAQGKDCPAGMALLKFAELTYKNNFVFFCSISRPASEKCSSRSENYCGEILGKVNVERVSRAAKAALLDPAIVRGSYLDSCARLRLKEFANWLERMQESPGAITRGEAATYLKPAREQLKSIADEIAQVGEAIKGIGSDEASKRLEKSSIAEWL